MDITYRPYIHPEFEELMERIHPPRVCIDNDSCPDFTLVEVDCANKHGILLEIVQVLTDLDLVISKSSISSDGGWLMDVFHVTDQQGKKITDERLIHYVKEGICASRRASREVKSVIIGEDIRPRRVWVEHAALEMTGIDRPGLMSEMLAVLTELGCHIPAAMAWTHKGRAACIIYVDDSSKGGPITDPCRAAQVQAQIENVVKAHHYDDEKCSVRLAARATGQTHTERRLHQLMAADRDYEECCSCCDGDNDDDQLYRNERCSGGQKKKECNGTHVKIDKCKENGYSVITIRSRDRPKLLFDTICTLTDLQYVVFHAAISSKGSTSLQEYYVRHENGHTLDSEGERHKVIQCLIAATERRVSHGLKLDICTKNRTGLLSDVTRVFRENRLSLTRVEIGVQGEKAVGSFFVKDMSGQKVSPETVKMMSQEIGSPIIIVSSKSSGTSPEATSSKASRSSSGTIQERHTFSLGNMLWERLERLSKNFRPIKS